MRVLSARAGKNANSRKEHAGAANKTAALVQPQGPSKPIREPSAERAKDCHGEEGSHRKEGASQNTEAAFVYEIEIKP